MSSEDVPVVRGPVRITARGVISMIDDGVMTPEYMLELADHYERRADSRDYLKEPLLADGLRRQAKWLRDECAVLAGRLGVHLETDEEVRKKVLSILAPDIQIKQSAQTAAGRELDNIASLFGLKREFVKDVQESSGEE